MTSDDKIDNQELSSAEKRAINESAARVLGGTTLESITSVHELCRKASAFAISQVVQIDLPKDTEKAWDVERRPYQIEAWRAIENARQRGDTEALIHLATGLGKTTVAVIDALRFIDEWLNDENNQKEHRLPRILFACHQNEILEQAADRFSQFAPQLNRGFFNGSNKELQSNITFATMQSLNMNIDKIPEDQFDYIIYDEAHHTQAKTFKTVVSHFKPNFQLALTATPDRLDRKDIRELFGAEIYSKSLPEALVEGWLADVDYHVVLEKGIEEILQSGFDPKTLDELYEIFGNITVNEKIAEQVKSEMHRLGLDKAKTIVFCKDIVQADEMADLLGGKSYHSDLPKKDREKILRDFKENGLQTIVTRDMFNEGVDVPDARLLVFLRGTASATIFQQQLGRGLRKHHEKQFVSVLDFVNNIDRLKHINDLLEEVEKVKKRLGIFETKDNKDSGNIGIHASFDFEKIAIDVLDKIEVLKNRFNWTNDEIIAAALEISPGSPLTQRQIRKRSREGRLPSAKTIANRFGSIPDFQRACGFEVRKDDWTRDEIISAALEINSESPLTQSQIEEQSKKGELPSAATIYDRFGSLSDFQRACGFDVKEVRKETWTRDEIISAALEISSERPLTQSQINERSKKGELPSVATIYDRFGSIPDFQRACGFKVKEARKETWTRDEIIAAALKIRSDSPLTVSQINERSKKGELPSVTTISKRFGSIPDFQKACGFKVK